jgi:hypothetical protein
LAKVGELRRDESFDSSLGRRPASTVATFLMDRIARRQAD